MSSKRRTEQNQWNEAFAPPAPLQTAVLFVLFNRPHTTAKVFEAIRKAKPPRLYVACDGPRADRKADAQKVKRVREIITSIDWPCEVKTLFHERNLGCKYAVSGAITWFFKHEEQGIILEDDCLPSQSFFWFCEELLLRYKTNRKVWHISGATVNKNINSHESYHFSAYPGIWGWASWANRWDPCDVELESISLDAFKNAIKQYTLCKHYWYSLFQRVKRTEIDTWDYQWIFKMWVNGGLCITPNRNLVSNIGFGNDATHTKDDGSSLACMPHEDIDVVEHPLIIAVNHKNDSVLKKKYFSNKNLVQKLIGKLL